MSFDPTSNSKMPFLQHLFVLNTPKFPIYLFLNLIIRNFSSIRYQAKIGDQVYHLVESNRSYSNNFRSINNSDDRDIPRLF